MVGCRLVLWHWTWLSKGCNRKFGKGAVALFIDCSEKNGKPYLRVILKSQVVRDGIKTERKSTIRNIGYLSDFDDGKPDYLGRLRKSFDLGEPIIKSLSDLCTTNKDEFVLHLKLSKVEKNEYSEFTTFNWGYFIITSILKLLGIDQVFYEYEIDTKCEINLKEIFDLLIVHRILKPGSINKYLNNEYFPLFDPIIIKNANAAYRALDHFDKLSDKILLRMHTKLNLIINMSHESNLYDVTNVYFEKYYCDEDTIDENGNLVKGLRKYGHSKESRPLPIVQIAYLIERNYGIPVGYKIFPGNTSDQTTLIPFLTKGVVSKMGLGKFVVIADAGLNRIENLAALKNLGYGYIVSRSAKNSPRDVKEWLVKGEGYTYDKENVFKLKSVKQERTYEPKKKKGSADSKAKSDDTTNKTTALKELLIEPIMKNMKKNNCTNVKT